MQNYTISTDDIASHAEKIWLLLKDCFWCKDIPLSYVKKFIAHSLCFGIYENSNHNLIGFGRVISDYVTYAYICDVIIAPLHRGKGLGNKLIKTILTHPELQGLKTWSLHSTDMSKKMYEKNGFKNSLQDNMQLEISDLEIYVKMMQNTK